MNYSLPYWMLVLQALAVPAIGLLAAVIGYFQWKTAQQDRRMATYTALREIVAMVGASSSAATPDNSFKFLEALDRAEFLFGAKVIEHLQKIRQAIDDIHDMATERKDLQPGPELIANVAKERAAREVVGSFYTTFQALVRPYIRNASEVILVALRKKAAARGVEIGISTTTLAATSGGSVQAKCHPSPHG
jgi:predicted lipid-binding transport protein (Tim44 family)